MTTLILVRHGESLANVNNIFAGSYDAELAERGEKQAKATAEYIKEKYNVDAIYSSDLKRAYKTGKIIADKLGLDVIKSEKLREIYAGKWEGVPFDEIVDTYGDDFTLWMTNISEARCTDGESIKELTERIMSELERIAKENPDKTVVVATHATPVRVAQTMIQYGEIAKMNDLGWVSNASLTIFTYDEGCWECVAVSVDEHLGGMKTTLPEKV